jgi:hypothetical protein
MLRVISTDVYEPVGVGSIRYIGVAALSPSAGKLHSTVAGATWPVGPGIR